LIVGDAIVIFKNKNQIEQKKMQGWPKKMLGWTKKNAGLIVIFLFLLGVLTVLKPGWYNIL